MNIESLNRWGDHFLNFAWPMLWQSSVLIGVIFILDLALRRKARAAVRYALWLVVLVKLLLPPTLALPTSPGWWIHSSAPPPAKAQPVPFTVTYDNQTMPDFQTPLPSIPIQKRPALSFAAWALVLSSMVSAGLLAWLLIRWWGVVGKIRDASGAEKLDAMLNESRCLAGLRSVVRLKLTGDSMSPAVCGLFRPVILLPRSLVEKLSAGQLRAVLLHELIHLRRGDVWVNCAQALLQIVYWWHPLLWLANARIRRAREEAVDDAVMLALRDGAEIYAPTLLEVAKFAFRRPLASLGLVGILESRSALRQRIERLVNFDAPQKAGLTVVSIFGILAFSAFALPMGQAPVGTNVPSNAALSGNDVSPTKLEIFRIYPPTNENHFNELLLNAGVIISPTVVIPERNGIVLAKGSEDQLALIRQVVLKLNGFPPNDRNSIGEPFMTFVTKETKPASTNLEMRTFKPDLHAFILALQDIRGLQTNNVGTMVESLFNKLGVDLTAPGRSIAFNDRLGLLFVKATPSELDTVERAVQALNFWEPQIHIKARFIEVPLSEVKAIWKAGTAVDFGETNTVEIITADKIKPLLRQLESANGSETLAEPEAVMSSGMQTQMRVIMTQEVVTNFALQEMPGHPTSIIPQMGKFEIGPLVDIVPYVLSDGYTIYLTAMPSKFEFLGYEDAPHASYATNSTGKRFKLPTARPCFRIQQAVAKVNLWDGQTLVLGNGYMTNYFVEDGNRTQNESAFIRAAEKKNRTADKELLVFITTWIVDPAGNRVHSDDELPFNPSTIPPQPKIPSPSR